MLVEVARRFVLAPASGLSLGFEAQPEDQRCLLQSHAEEAVPGSGSVEQRGLVVRPGLSI